MGITEKKAGAMARTIRITMVIRVTRAGIGITGGATGIIGAAIMRCTTSTTGSEV
jgi:hypothetical protein